MKRTICGTNVTVIHVPQWLARPWAKLWAWACGRAIDAVTIGHTVFLLCDVEWPDLLVHETMHARQAERYEPRWLPVGRRLVGTLIFGVLYAVEHLRHGYARNRYEVEAYAEQERYISWRLRNRVVLTTPGSSPS